MATYSQTGVQTLTVSSTAVGLTVPTGMRPSHAIIQVRNANIRWRADGTAPTTSAGMQVAAGTDIEFMDGENNYQGLIQNFQAIRDDAADAELEIAFFSV